MSASRSKTPGKTARSDNFLHSQHVRHGAQKTIAELLYCSKGLYTCYSLFYVVAGYEYVVA